MDRYEDQTALISLSFNVFFDTMTEHIHITWLTNRPAGDIYVSDHYKKNDRKLLFVITTCCHVDAVVKLYNTFIMTFIFALCLDTMNIIYKSSAKGIAKRSIGIWCSSWAFWKAKVLELDGHTVIDDRSH